MTNDYHKMINKVSFNHAFLLILIAQFLVVTHLSGQAQLIDMGNKEPVFIIRVEQNGKSGDVSYTSVLERTYAPCSQWTGGSVGLGNPAGFIANAGGLLGLKPKMAIPFYARSFLGEAKGSDGSTATVITVGDGLGYWTEQHGSSSGSTKCTDQDDPDDQPSKTMSARFERTEMGARITFDAGLVSAGCATYIGFISLHQMEIESKLIQQFCTFELTNEEMKNWKTIKKEKAQVFKDENGTLTISAMLTVEVEPLIVTLSGCTDLGVGEQAKLTATATKKGGSFRFWSEPGDLFSITSDGSASATITGLAPGRGKLYVEYKSADGKKAQNSLVAACVQIDSYNGGQPIPQIAFYDMNGKKKSGIITVPINGKPENIAESVMFEPVNPGVLSAEGTGSGVMLQGITTGKTILQAKTKCGSATGPAVEVDVVNCDDETIARLEKMEKAAIENLVAAAKDLQSIAGSKEFEKARDDLVSSYINLIAKIGLTVVTGGKTSGIVTKVENGKKVISTAIPLAADIADNGSALSEIIGSANLGELGVNTAKPVAGKTFEEVFDKKFVELAKEGYGKALSAIIGLYEVGEAADKFYDNVGTIKHYEDIIEQFQKILERAEDELKFVKSRQQLCSRQKGNPDKDDIPLAELKPLPKDPKAPTKPTPKKEESNVQQPDKTKSERPKSDDEILIDPEPPVLPPRQVGLPYQASDCGCDNTKDLTVSSESFSNLGKGIGNLGECVKNFGSTALKDYRQALEELSAITDSLSMSINTDTTAFLMKAVEAKPRIDAIVVRIRAYDKISSSFLKKMEKCPESLTIGMDIFQSVEKITVDMIKAKY